jgi:predicted dinucleotide-binding enzyme
VLAVPFVAVAETVAAIGETGGTIVVDATNVVGEALPPTAHSIVDVVASVNPDAVIVKAFNTIGAEAFLDPSIDGRALFLPVAGDRPAADTVAAMAEAIGFDALVVGDRTVVPLLEAHAALWIHLALRTGLGRGFGFARMERTGGAAG